MTIVSARIYYYANDKDVERKVTFTHWGFAEWFARRLKPIREQLRGPEAKGVNIVNFMLFEDSSKAWRLNEWSKRMNSFEYDLCYDVRSLLERPPIENIEHLMKTTARLASLAPWPQVVAVGKVLSVPLSVQDHRDLEPFLRWPRTLAN